MKFAVQHQNHFSISILQQYYGIGSEYKRNCDCFNHEGVINIISLNPTYATSFRSLVNDVVVGKFCRVWFDRGSLKSSSNDSYFQYLCAKYHFAASFASGSYGKRRKTTEVCQGKTESQIQSSDFSAISSFIHYLFNIRTTLLEKIESRSSILHDIVSKDHANFPMYRYIKKLVQLQTFSAFCSIIFSRFKTRLIHRDQAGVVCGLEELTLPLWLFFFFEEFRLKRNENVVKITFNRTKFGNNIEYLKPDIRRIDDLKF
ncbi:hypothetical protein WICMUC_005110 [Wickerhamomyces mucosus]|uniref:Uncharacterized protein n=1 Tax=Wickerhamomyces mucosus TaxID=1378264 RepID=A0A9P8PCZ8_9ASCO|nr:hypothetical protein WICMUC_005110 [Wickerhamomyces mucosus]